MKLGIMYPNVLGKSLEEMEKMKEHGIPYLQLNPSLVSDENHKMTPAGEKALRALDGVEIVAWCGYRSLIGNAEDVEKSVAEISRIVELVSSAREAAGDAVTPLVLSESGNPDAHKDFSYDELWNQIVEATKQIAERAEANNVCFGFEPTRANILDSSKTTRRLIDEVGSDSIKVCFDPANICGDKDTIESAIENLKNSIAIAHAKDVHFGPDGKVAEYPSAGKGDLDYADVFKRLEPITDCKHIVIEYVRSPEQALETINFLKPFCD